VRNRRLSFHLVRRSRTQELARGFVCLVLLTSFQHHSHGDDRLNVVLEAFRASSKGLESGVGRGSYRHYQGAKQDNTSLTVEGSVEYYFDRNKYHLTIEYSKTDSGDNSRAIIFDGNVIACTIASKSIHPIGQETRIYLPSKSGTVFKPVPMFPWDVSRLSSNVEDLEQIVRNITPERIKIEGTRGGDLSGSFPLSPAGLVRFECPKGVGFNLAKEQVFASPGGPLVQDFELQWNQSKQGLWYVTAIVEQFTSTSPGNEVSVKDELLLTDFKPNVEVDPRLFTLASLNMKPGSTILDLRDDTHREVYHARAKDSELEPNLDSIASQVKALSKDFPSQRPESSKRSRNSVVILVLVNVIIACIFFAAVAIARFRRQR
jgi:hypothetical protein